MGGKHGVDPAAAVQQPGFVRRWFAGLGVAQIRRYTVLVVLAVTALFGGLDTVDTKVTDFKPGDAFSDGEFTITIERASLVREITAGRKTIAYATPGRRYLGVIATVRNDGTVPGSLWSELALRDLPDKQFRSVFRVADGSLAGSLGPGLSDQVAFVWELPENAIAEGDSVSVRIWKKRYSQLALTYSPDGKMWLASDTEYGQTTVPVRVPS